jgi:hypothetical protein
MATKLAALTDPSTTIKATVVENGKGVGLPFATIILSGVLSAAAFGVQMVQHSFEMRQANIENGFRFYFDNRSPLAARTDADREMSLLKLIGNAFPNVYCDVREDVYQRASSADVYSNGTPGPSPFGEPDRKNLISFLVSHDRPTTAQFATGIFGIVGAALNSGSNGAPVLCPSLGQQQQFAALQVQQQNAPANAPAAGAVEKDKQTAAATATPQTADNETVVRGQAQGAERVFRVFFHIGLNPSRSTDVADKFRDELANDHYRVMHGVIRVEHVPEQGEVRYFGPEEKDSADRLAAYLTDKFKPEKVIFTAKAIGETFPWMSPDNLEVWIPDPKAARKAPSKGAQ